MRKIIFGIVFLLLANAAYAQQFRVSFNKDLAKQPFSGNVYVFLSKNDREPMRGENWIMMNPVSKAKVENLMPGQVFTIGSANAQSYPVAFDDLERGEYFAQIVFDGNYGGRAVKDTTGNFYSSPHKVSLTRDTGETFSLVADKIIRAPTFKETAYTKKIELASPLLSSFYKKPSVITAVVRLPKEYAAQSAQKFPLKVSIGGFGADVNQLSGNENPAEISGDGIPFVHLRLDGNCPTGHTGYANSANNGPWGDALVHELIPHIEKNFRLDGFRFVTGHSSGGWSALWLQTHYPNEFHGAWSSSPDAIDFRNFEGVNIYTDANIFYDGAGKLLPGMKVGRHFINYKRDVCAWERIVRGEQYMSFNAVFGGRRSDGSIDYLWDFSTGAINPAQREHWRKYDISNYLTANWNRLKPQLADKILITSGDADNWSLEKAVLLLKKDAEEKRMEINFKIISGDHFTVHTSDKDKFGAEHAKKIYDAWLSKK